LRNYFTEQPFNIVRGARYRGFPACSRQVIEFFKVIWARVYFENFVTFITKKNDGDGFQEIFPISAVGQVSQRPRQIHLSAKLSKFRYTVAIPNPETICWAISNISWGITASRHFANLANGIPLLGKPNHLLIFPKTIINYQYCSTDIFLCYPFPP